MNRVPISLEALAEEYKRQMEAQNKPRFVSKEEREQLAVRRREQEEEKQRQGQLEEQRRREEYLRGKHNTAKMDIVDDSNAALTDQDREAIKQRYLGGGDKNPKKLRRFTDRRFLFDWDESDDTAKDASFEGNVARGPSSKHSEKKFERDIGTHWSRKPADQMKERDWRILKEDFNIATQGGSIPHPIRFWEEAAFGQTLRNLVVQLGFEEPTPIQRQAIPIALQKRDLIGIAETGSGKTLAFLLPMFEYIRNLPKITQESALDGPYGLILAPTRELAQQIEHEAKKFAKPLGYSVLAIVGGHSVAEQSMHLRRGVEIVIATPGRLRDCLEQHVLALNQCYSLVMDEADRMIDMNYEEDLNFILECLPSASTKPDSDLAEDASKLIHYRYRQTTMFSATMPPSVERLARLYLRRPVTVTVGQAGQAVDRIFQKVIMLNEHEKSNKLVLVLQEYSMPAIVFVNQKTTVDFLTSRLNTLGFKAVALHGGKGQEQREVAIAQLKSSSRDILIATDVASRGIDIKNIALIVNYDMAKTIEDYVHRIGRTGRAGKEGTAVTFLTDKDAELYYDLKLMLQKSKNSEMPSEFANHEAARQKAGTVQQKRKHEEKIFAYGV